MEFEGYRSDRGEQPIPNSIAILRALQLGDLMCAIPAIRMLRKGYPNAVIGLIGLPWAREFVARFSHLIDRFIEFPGYPGLAEQEPRIREIPGFLGEMQNQKFDLILQMQGSGNIANSLTVLLGGEHSAGFYLEGHFRPDPNRYILYPIHEPEVIRHIRLMEHLGLPPVGTNLEFPISSQDETEFHSLPEYAELIPGRTVCIHAGARSESRRWNPEKFAAVADAIFDLGFQVVLTGSPDEAEIARAVLAPMRRPAVNLVGKTSLGALGVLISRSRLVVCNDTGVSHIADAVDTPSVVLFSDSDPTRWAPLNASRHRPVPWASAVEPEAVLMEVQQILKEEPIYAS